MREKAGGPGRGTHTAAQGSPASKALPERLLRAAWKHGRPPCGSLTPHLGAAKCRGRSILSDIPRLPYDFAPAPGHSLGASYHHLCPGQL